MRGGSSVVARAIRCKPIDRSDGKSRVYVASRPVVAENGSPKGKSSSRKTNSDEPEISAANSKVSAISAPGVAASGATVKRVADRPTAGVAVLSIR